MSLKGLDRRIPFKTKQELAYEYQVSYITILRYCRMIGIETDGRALSPKQVRKFYDHFGEP